LPACFIACGLFCVWRLARAHAIAAPPRHQKFIRYEVSNGIARVVWGRSGGPSGASAGNWCEVEAGARWYWAQAGQKQGTGAVEAGARWYWAQAGLFEGGYHRHAQEVKKFRMFQLRPSGSNGAMNATNGTKYAR